LWGSSISDGVLDAGRIVHLLPGEVLGLGSRLSVGPGREKHDLRASVLLVVADDLHLSAGDVIHLSSLSVYGWCCYTMY